MLEHFRTQGKTSLRRDTVILRHERESIPRGMPGRRPDAGQESPDNAHSDGRAGRRCRFVSIKIGTNPCWPLEMGSAPRAA